MRLANVNGRAAAVIEERFIDLGLASAGALSRDPMALFALQSNAALDCALLAPDAPWQTLNPAELLFTVTSAGVGLRMTPKRDLVPGDLVETTLEGVGALGNRAIVERSR